MDGLLIILTYLSSSSSLLLLFCVNLRAVWETASVGPPTWATQGQRGLMLLVKSAGTCSEQLFTTTLMCLCVHLRAIVWCFLLRTHRTHICVCVCIPGFTHPDPLCGFCHFKHPLLQCSVTKHLLYSNLLMSDPPERGGIKSSGRRRISWVFIFSC